MTGTGTATRIHTIVIGAGQAGLSVGYHLAKRNLDFLLLDSNQRIGDSWRRRWDSLRLFTPARFDGLAGLPFPASPHSFPTKDEMADYLESYAQRFRLPVQMGVTVDRLSKHRNGYVISAGDRQYEAEHVVVAMSDYQRPRVPSFAAELGHGITQFHSSEYRNLAQLRPGGVLVVGAGNSGADIALETARGGHRTWLSGRSVGHLPVRVDGLIARVLNGLVFRGLYHRVLTVNTPIGRMLRDRMVSRGGPLIRVKPHDLAAAGVERVSKVAGTRDGWPVLHDQRVIEAANVIWCTGFHPGFSWIDLPTLGSDGRPIQHRGVVTNEPGLYFVGLMFLYSPSSVMIHGVGRDAEYIADTILSRTQAGDSRLRVRPDPLSAWSFL